MTATFPSGVKQFPVINPGDPILSSTENAQQEEIVAIETEYRRMGLHNLADPGANRVLFWDDSAGALKWLQVDGIVGTALGQWQNWTPTVAYAGGTTYPTSFTIIARYTRIGKLVVCVITGTLVRGSGDHAYISFTPPVSIEKSTTGSCTHQFLGEFNVAPCYMQGGIFVINTGTWTSDGSLWSTWIYETS